MTESSATTIEIRCPQCGRNQNVQPCQTIRPGSAELEKLMRGQLNRFSCQFCETAFVYPVPLVYRDDARRVLYYYMPTPNGEKSEAALQLVDRQYRDLFADMEKEKRPVCRLVFSRPHLIEKIQLLEHELDDRLLEYVKYLLLQNVKELDIHQHELLFDFMHDSSSSIHFFVYDRQTKKPVSELNFPRADWDQLHGMFLGTPQAEAKLDSLFPDYCVCVDELLGLNEPLEPDEDSSD